MAVHSFTERTIWRGPQRVGPIAEQMVADFAERSALHNYRRMATLRDLLAEAAARADAYARLDAALRAAR